MADRPSESITEAHALPEQLSDGADPPPAPAAVRWSPPRVAPRALIIIALLIVAGVIAILWAWRIGPFQRAVQSTENAYVRGQTTLVSPQVSGYAVAVPAQDYQQVHAGEVLVQIDDRIYRQRVEQAQANVATANAQLANSVQAQASKVAGMASSQAGVTNARAQLARAQADYDRISGLSNQGWVTRATLDAALAALRQAQAGVQQAEAGTQIAAQDIRTVEVGRGGLQAGVQGAEAAVRLAQIDLANTVIRAPVDGQLGEVGVRVGQYVTAGTQLMFLVPGQLWVTANFKEEQTAKMRPGQRASFTVDALGKARLWGQVEQLAPAAGSEFSVIKTDNATGNFVKVPQRIAVRIRIDPGQPLAARLRPGMSVEARVETD
jgi:multidrug resistance efflux pump